MSDEFDLDNLDDGWGGTDDLGGGFNIGETGNDRNAVMSMVSGTMDSFTTNIVDTKTIQKGVMNSLPRDVSNTITDVTAPFSAIADEMVDVTKEISKGAFNAKENIKYLAPEKTHGVIDKLSDFLGIKDRSEPNRGEADLSAAEIAAQTVATTLDEVFGNQQHDREHAVIKEAGDDAKHLQTIVELNKSSSGLELLTGFNTNIQTPYMKKDLELSIKTFLMLERLTGATIEHAKINKAQLEGVIKNTGLPDVLKIQGLENQWQRSVDSAFSQLSAGALGAGSDAPMVRVLQGAAGNVKRKLFNKVDTVLDGMDKLETGADAKEQMEDTGGTATEMASGVAGGVGAAYLVNKAFGAAFSKLAETTQGKGLLNKARDFGETGDRAANDFFSNKAQEQEDDGFVLRQLRKLASFGADLTQDNGLSQDTISINATGNAGSVVSWTDKDSDAMTTVIPGYLKLILRELQITRTGKDQDLINYDKRINDFVTEGDSRAMTARMMDKITENGYEDSSTRFVKNLGRTLDKTHSSAIKDNDIQLRDSDKTVIQSVFSTIPNYYNDNPGVKQIRNLGDFAKDAELWDYAGVGKTQSRNTRARLNAMVNGVGDQVGIDDNERLELSRSFKDISSVGTSTTVIDDAIRLGRAQDLVDLGVISPEDMAKTSYSVNVSSILQKKKSGLEDTYVQDSLARAESSARDQRSMLDSDTTGVDLSNVSGISPEIKSLIEGLSNPDGRPANYSELTTLINATDFSTEVTLKKILAHTLKEPTQVNNSVSDNVFDKEFPTELLLRLDNLNLAIESGNKDLIGGIHNLHTGFNDMGDKLSESYHNAADRFVTGIGEVRDKVGSLEGTLGEKLVSVKDVIGSQTSGISQAVSAGVSSAGSVLGALLFGASSATTSAMSQIPKVLGGAKDLIGTLAQSGINIAGKGVGALMGAGGMMGAFASSMPMGIAGAGLTGAGWLLGKVSNQLTNIADKKFEIAGSVYIKGVKEPILTKGKMEAGEYFDNESGEPIRYLSDIKGPVRDANDILISSDDVKRGLYNSKGRKLPVSRAGLDSIKNMVGGLIGSPLSMVGSAIDLASTIGGGVVDATGDLVSLGKDGITGLLDRLIPGRKISEEQIIINNTILEDQLGVMGKQLSVQELIYELLLDRIPQRTTYDGSDKDKDGDRDGSFADIFEQRDQANNMVSTDDDVVPTEKSGSSMLSKLLKVALDMAPMIVGALGTGLGFVTDAIGGLGGTIATVIMGALGLKKASDLLGNSTDVDLDKDDKKNRKGNKTKGKRGLAKRALQGIKNVFGGSPTSKVKTAAQLTGSGVRTAVTANMVRSGATVAGVVATGAGATLASATVIAPTLAYGAYRLFKSEHSDYALTDLRFNRYGMRLEHIKTHGKFLMVVESYTYKATTFGKKGEKLSINFSTVQWDQMLSDLGVDPSNSVDMNRFSKWYNKVFLPLFVKYLSMLHNAGSVNHWEKPDKLSKDLQQTYVTGGGIEKIDGSLQYASPVYDLWAWGVSADELGKMIASTYTSVNDNVSILSKVFNASLLLMPGLNPNRANSAFESITRDKQSTLDRTNGDVKTVGNYNTENHKKDLTMKEVERWKRAKGMGVEYVPSKANDNTPQSYDYVLNDTTTKTSAITDFTINQSSGKKGTTVNKDMVLLTRQKAVDYGIDPDIATKVIGYESGFDPQISSPTKAGGLGQLTGVFIDDVKINSKHKKVLAKYKGMTNHQIKMNPEANLDFTYMGWDLIKKRFKSWGINRKLDLVELYLAHNVGAASARVILLGLQKTPNKKIHIGDIKERKFQIGGSTFASVYGAMLYNKHLYFKSITPNTKAIIKKRYKTQQLGYKAVHEYHDQGWFTYNECYNKIHSSLTKTINRLGVVLTGPKSKAVAQLGDDPTKRKLSSVDTAPAVAVTSKGTDSPMGTGKSYTGDIDDTYTPEINTGSPTKPENRRKVSVRGITGPSNSPASTPVSPVISVNDNNSAYAYTHNSPIISTPQRTPDIKADSLSILKDQLAVQKMSFNEHSEMRGIQREILDIMKNKSDVPEKTKTGHRKTDTKSRGRLPNNKPLPMDSFKLNR